jgi:energy-coupling factor transporter ATP-binding protein EcfA2
MKPTLTTKECLIRVDQLSFQFETDEPLLFKNVGFEIFRKDAVLMLGPSGCGKSTLAFCLNGLYPEAVDGFLKGEIQVDYRLLQEYIPGEVCRKIGIVFQDPDSQFCMVYVEDEIAFGLENLQIPAAQIDRQIDQALGWVGLQAYRNEQIHKLSGGMKQKLALACVLAMKPDIIILDEPTALLDPVSTRELVQLIGNLREELDLTLIIIEHKLDEWMDIINRTMIFDEDGTIEVFEDPRACFDQQEEDLQAKGIWTPAVSRIGHRWKREGIYTGTIHPLTEEELIAGINSEQRTQALKQLQDNGAELGADIEFTPLSEVILQVQDLSYSRGEQSILKDISCEIYDGEWIAIVGPNGAGKTTFAHHLAGIMRSSNQSVIFKGKDLSRWNEKELRKEIGFVFQNPEHQFIKDTVYEELAFGLRLQGFTEEEINSKVKQTLEVCKLSGMDSANPFSLSQGQKRRLSVAVMLVDEQKLLILDEPTFGQDAFTSKQLMNLLAEGVKKGRTLVMITHDMELVREHADRVFVLNKGLLFYAGPPHKLWEDQTLVKEARLLPPIYNSIAQKLQTRKEIELNVVK